VLEVDCVSLGVPGGEGLLRVTPASERAWPKGQVLFWTKRGAVRSPTRAGSDLPGKSSLTLLPGTVCREVGWALSVLL